MAKQKQHTNALRGLVLSMGMMLIAGNQLLAAGGSSSISAGEILMYVALIIGVILAAWFLSSGKRNSDTPTNAANKPHFDHPNDPHFRRLRKKTS
jgi:hypothetical protein